MSKALHAALGALKLAPRLPAAGVLPVSEAYLPGEDDRGRRTRAIHTLRHIRDILDPNLAQFQAQLLRRADAGDLALRLLQRPLARLVRASAAARTEPLPAHALPPDTPGAGAARVSPLLLRLLAELPSPAAEDRRRRAATAAAVAVVAFDTVPALPLSAALPPRRALALARAALTRVLAARTEALAARSGATAFRLHLVTKLAAHWLPLGVRQDGFADAPRPAPATITLCHDDANDSTDTGDDSSASTRKRRGGASENSATKRSRPAATATAPAPTTTALTESGTAAAGVDRATLLAQSSGGLADAGPKWLARLRPLAWGQARLIRPDALLRGILDAFTAAAYGSPAAVLSPGECASFALLWLHVRHSL